MQRLRVQICKAFPKYGVALTLAHNHALDTSRSFSVLRYFFHKDAVNDVAKGIASGTFLISQG